MSRPDGPVQDHATLVVPTQAPSGRGSQGRRAGYVIAALINLVIWFLAIVSPGWQVVPFLTDATADLMPLFSLLLLSQVAANTAYAIFDSTGLKRVVDVPLAVLSLAFAIQVLVVFPFAFEEQGLPVLATFIVWIALIGSLVALIVNSVRLVTWIVRKVAG